MSEWVILRITVSGLLRKWIQSSLILLTSVPAFAGGFVPSINSLPILHSPDPKYHDASVKFQEAFFLQTGITQQYNVVAGYVEGEANQYVKKAEVEVYYVLDEYTPLDPKAVFFTGAVAYGLFVQKRMTRSFKNPWFKPMTHTVTIGQDHGATGIQIPF